MKLLIIALFCAAFANVLWAAGDKLTVVKGVLTDIIKEYYEETNWGDIVKGGKKLNGKLIRITGVLYRNPYKLDGGNIPALFEIGDINENPRLNCIQIPNVYSKVFQAWKLGSKVEIYGVFFAEEIAGPEKDRYTLIRIDAIFESTRKK